LKNEQEFIDLLHERYYYKDGVLFYKKDIGYKVKKDAKVGSVNAKGYLATNVNYIGYKVHRLIFAMHHRYFPEVIDHIDRNKLNNKIENLREVSVSENVINSGLSSRNTSKYKGVHFCNREKKWIATVCRKNKRHYIGGFATLEEAYQARVKFLERELNEKHLQ